MTDPAASAATIQRLAGQIDALSRDLFTIAASVETLLADMQRRIPDSAGATDVLSSQQK